jgi:hypothetical protein
MPKTEYEEALANLGDDSKRALEGVFAVWSGEAELTQVFQNIKNETALAANSFASLLNAFAAQLARGNSPVDSLRAACHAHQRKGRQMPDADRPVILGRAKGLNDHATSLAKASSGTLTKEEAEKLLLKYAGSLNPTELDGFLRETPLGRYNLVWATFDSSNPGANPFDRLPISHAGIRAALGLGEFTDTLIILVWHQADSGSPPLHRPTIADAADFRHYRPNPDRTALWGLTAPPLPNPDRLQPQPEVVMPDPTSKGLRLPFLIVLA